MTTAPSPDASSRLPDLGAQIAARFTGAPGVTALQLAQDRFRRGMQPSLGLPLIDVIHGRWSNGAGWVQRGSNDLPFVTPPRVVHASQAVLPPMIASISPLANRLHQALLAPGSTVARLQPPEQRTVANISPQAQRAADRPLGPPTAAAPNGAALTETGISLSSASLTLAQRAPSPVDSQPSPQVRRPSGSLSDKVDDVAPIAAPSHPVTASPVVSAPQSPAQQPFRAQGSAVVQPSRPIPAIPSLNEPRSSVESPAILPLTVQRSLATSTTGEVPHSESDPAITHDGLASVESFARRYQDEDPMAPALPLAAQQIPTPAPLPIARVSDSTVQARSGPIAPRNATSVSELPAGLPASGLHLTSALRPLAPREGAPDMAATFSLASADLAPAERGAPTSLIVAAPASPKTQPLITPAVQPTATAPGLVLARKEPSVLAGASLLQRAASPEDTATAEPAATSPSLTRDASAEAAAKTDLSLPPSPEIDLERLTDQVYFLLERRLTVERERLGL